MTPDQLPDGAQPRSGRTRPPVRAAAAAAEWAGLPTAARSRLSITCEEYEDLVLLRMEGELDIYTSRALRDELGRWDPETVQLVLELGRVKLLDSAGLSALVSLRNEADRAGRTVAVIRPRGGAIARLFTLCGLHRAFILADDLAGVRRAVAAAGAPPAASHGRTRTGRRA